MNYELISTQTALKVTSSIISVLLTSFLNDSKREQIWKYLYERHKTSRGITQILIGIRDLQK